MALHQRSIASRFLFVLVLALPRSSESAVITVGGACNLNAAIEAANTDTSKGGCTAGSVADFLELTSAVLLKLVDNDTDGPNGLPSITSTIAIDGNGKFIARDVWSEPMPPPFRIFHVAESGDLTLENLLVVEGLVDTKGGGILNRGNLVLRSAFGGGIYADGELTVLNSTISGNTASGSEGGHGGGNLADDTTCKITIAGTLSGLDSTLADNGGPTKTHRLLDGSSAIDISATCGLRTDQRGAGRMSNCDGGAFEHLGEGCELSEFEDLTIADSSFALVCHTALVGPEFVIEGPSGKWALYAGYMVGLRDGFEARDGGELTITIDPLLLP